MITTVIGAYPKPSYLKLTDWFNASGGTDNENPTKLYAEEIINMGNCILFFSSFTKAFQTNCAVTVESLPPL